MREEVEGELGSETDGPTYGGMVVESIRERGLEEAKE